MEATLRRPPEPGKWVSAAFSLLMHAALALVLFYGVQWQRRAPEPVSVELVRGLPSVQAQAQPEVAPPPPPRPASRPAPVPKPVVKAEPEPVKPVAKPDTALKEPKPKKEPVRKIEKPMEEPKPAKKLKEPVKAEPKEPEPKPTQKAEDVDRRRFDQLLNRDIQRVGKARQDDKLASAQADASGKRAAAENAAANGRALQEWGDRIRAKVRPKIVRPRDYPGDPMADVEIDMLIDGSLAAEPRLLKSTGHPELDEALKRAIIAASPFPLPSRSEVFQRKLILIFHPMAE